MTGSSSIVTCVFVAAGMCLRSRCLAMDVCSGFTIAAFRRHVTLLLFVFLGGRANYIISTDSNYISFFWYVSKLPTFAIIITVKYKLYYIYCGVAPRGRSIERPLQRGLAIVIYETATRSIAVDQQWTLYTTAPRNQATIYISFFCNHRKFSYACL
jgi:hypothetical protein